MYDSLITLIQMLDESGKTTSYHVDEYDNHEGLKISIKSDIFIYEYTQRGISKAIEELEDKL